MKSDVFRLNAIALGLLIATNSAMAADTHLVSGVSGKNIVGTSKHPALNNDGSLVTFVSNTGALIGDSSSTQHVYLKNLLNNSIQRVSVHSNGNAGNSISFNPKLSGDGRYIVYYSLATNLISSDSNNTTDIFRYDVTNKTTSLVSSNISGTISNGESTEADISQDGRFIAFSSLATNLVNKSTSGKRNVYVKDMQTGSIEIVSVNNSGTPGSGDSFSPAMSSDGRFIAFSSIANNLDNYSANNQYDIYVHDRQTKTTERIAFAHNGGLSNGHSGQVSISDDGKILAFISQSNNIVSNDSNNQIDIFIHDRTTNKTSRITPPSGETNGPSFYPHVSGNGRFISFYSGANNLTSNDNNGRNDLFVYDRILGHVTLASVASNGAQIDNNIDSIFASNYDGTKHVFATSSSLDVQDNNMQLDVYLRQLDPPPNIKPVAKAEPVPSQVCHNGGATVTLDASASSDADNDTLSYSWSGPFGTVSGKIVDVILGPGNHTVTLTVTDSRGDSHSQSINVSVTDTVAPSVIAGAPATVEATSTNGAVYTVNYDASDNCQLENISITPSISTYPMGSTTVTIAASDTLGNTASDSTTVTVRDTTPPTLSAPANISKEANAVLSTVNIGNATASDIFPVTVSNNAPTSYVLGKTTVKWTAKDSNGNSSTANQSITVKDTTPPVIVAPGDLTVEATTAKMSVVIGDATASDIFLDKISHNAPALFPFGTTKVTWSASDTSGNVASAIQTILVQDTIAPTLSGTSNVVLEATSTQGAQYDVPYTVNDSCMDCGPITVNLNPNLNYYPLGVTNVTLTATDASNNSSSNDLSITVQDTTAPQLTVPGDIEVEATAINSIVNINTATATDIFSVDISNNAPASFPIGSTTVTWTATDANGNKTTGNQLITVKDTTAPVLNVPANVTQEAQAKLTPVDIGQASASDIFKYTISNNAPSSYPLGNTTVTWTAIDEHGNKSTATQLVTIVDTTPPSLNAGNDVVLEAVSKAGTPFTMAYQVSDICDCGDINIEISPILSHYPLGDTTLTIKATDISGNSTTDSMVVKVVDTTSPELQAPANILQEASGVLTPVVLGNAIAKDIFDVTVVNNSPGVFPLGTSNVTWTATDSNSNVSTAIQSVTIVDTTAPTFELNMLKTKLRRPNHRMVHVGIVENVSDIVDDNSNVNIEITHNGEDHKHRHKHKRPDWKVVQNGDTWEIWVRAEKNHRSQEDRVYSINVTVTDFTGNQSVQSSEVVVPRRHKKHEQEDQDDGHEARVDDNREFKKDKHARKHDREKKRRNDG